MADQADYAALDKIRPRIEWDEDDLDEMERFGNKWFVDRMAEFKTCSCPACGSSEICDEVDSVSGAHYVRCADCKTLYMSPRPSKEHYEQHARESRVTYWEKLLETSRDARTERIYRPRLAENGAIAPHPLSFYDRITHDPDIGRDFQQFVRDHMLSSHMMTIARKLS